jgi:PhoPQ-activated pathogenicity-related protein
MNFSRAFKKIKGIQNLAAGKTLPHLALFCRRKYCLHVVPITQTVGNWAANCPQVSDFRADQRTEK